MNTSSTFHVMLIMALASAAFEHLKDKLPDMELKEYSSEDMYPPFNQTPTNDGGCYEKPNGHCYFDQQGRIAGCSCDPSQQFLYNNWYKRDVLFVVCGEGCDSVTTCPDSPVGDEVCLEGNCALACSTDSDCINGGVCIYKKGCMYLA